MKEKVDLAAQMMENKLLPTDYIYENIFHLSEDQYDEYRNLIAEDAKRRFRLAQIENEGNDPLETGKSYGTPHDLAALYGRGRYDAGEVHVGYDENVDLAFLFFRAESPSFSFVKIDSVGKVIQVAEKDPISPFAICSTYFIESSNKLFRFWDQIARTDKQSEKYLSQLAQTYLEHNLEVVAFELDSIHIYGTPDSLETAERYSR
jgi:hypothetical protein